MEHFQLQKSLVRRLRAIMIAIAVFFILGFFGIYLSSLGFLRGLTEINSANTIFALTTRSIEGLDSSVQNLERLTTSKKVSDVRFAHRQSLKIIKQDLANTMALTEDRKGVQELLRQALESLLLFEESGVILFSKVSGIQEQKSPEEVEAIKAEILVAKQFSIEAKENLRKAQITLRERTDSLFDSIFRDRFRPLIVTTVMSILFFSFVVTFGFSFTRGLGRSIENLTRSTEDVGKGNLGHQAPIIEPDEIGQLTFAFNDMVNSLREGRNELRFTLDRIRRLQEITAAFSEALTVDQVCEVTVTYGFEALGADAGAIALMSEDADELVLKRDVGMPHDAIGPWQQIPMKAKLPMPESLRYSTPIFIESVDEMIKRYPHLKDSVLKYHMQSWAFVPLEVATSRLGVLGFYFNEPRTFNQGERDFIMAMGRQCAQALHRSELYDDAKEAIQARDEFLSIASHELKTPLTPLKLQLQMLARKIRKDEELSPDRMVKIVETSDKQLGRLSRLIEDLLDVSRITTGRLTLNMERVNIGEMIKEVVGQYGSQLKEALRKVEVVDGKDIVGEFDRVRMEQVLINLLTNAVKYAPGKPIRVELQEYDGRVRIKVTDQGPGIAKENQKRIFDRFERVAGSDNIGGLRLGLYISRQIVLAHKGDIWVESEVGKGSTFIIDVPLSQAEASLSSAQLH